MSHLPPPPATPYPIDDAFNVAFVDALARQETYNKHHYRPNSYLHKWWARRCGTTFRAILKHLVSDAAQRDYYHAGGLAGRVVLDPMMGGGTTVHEAIRLGANVVGVDIDPIPVLQARATLSDLALPALRRGFAGFQSALHVAVGALFCTHCPTCDQATPLRHVLYGLHRRCDCGEVVCVDALTLRHNSDGSCVTIDPHSHAIWHAGRVVSAPPTAGPPLVTSQTPRCAHCGCAYRDDRRMPYYQRYRPLAIVGVCPTDGLFFRAPDARDAALLAQADAQRDTLFDAADFALTPGPKSQHLLRRGVRNYLDLFSSRQLLLLRAAIDTLRALPDDALRLNLALLTSTALEFNSLLCGYKGWHRRRPGAIKHTFVRHAYSLPYTALENNPLVGRQTSGTFEKLFQSRIVRARRWAAAPVERRIDGAQRISAVKIAGERDGGQEVTTTAELAAGTQRFRVVQANAATLPLPDQSVDFIVTDPPYYDSVQYGDLAEFFHVWLRQMLPTAAQWQYALADSAINQHDDGAQYGELLAAIFQECQRVLKQANGRFIFTFHHWKPRAWAALTIALRRADFVLVNRYVVHSEHPTSVHIFNQRALQHDVILVLRPRSAAPVRNWDAPAAMTPAAMTPAAMTPAAVVATDSATFCAQCGTLLGALLNSGADEALIAATWQAQLGR